jgi:hypothetical protein
MRLLHLERHARYRLTLVPRRAVAEAPWFGEPPWSDVCIGCEGVFRRHASRKLWDRGSTRPATQIPLGMPRRRSRGNRAWTGGWETGDLDRRVCGSRAGDNAGTVHPRSRNRSEQVDDRANQRPRLPKVRTPVLDPADSGGRDAATRCEEIKQARQAVRAHS